MEAGGIQGFPSMKTFAQLAEAGISCPRFTALCSWLVSELRTLCQLEENVNPTCGPEDTEMFQIEMHGLLNELYCPYPSLITGDVRTRLSTRDNCLQLLYFLSSELLAARLQAWKNLRSAKEVDRNGEAVQELRYICQALGVPEPQPLSSVGQVMAGIGSQVSTVLSTQSPEHQLMAPLLKTPLAPEQWKVLEEVHRALQAEYQSRIRMMLTRFDVTVVSFHWSERAKERSAAMVEAFRPLRLSWLENSQVTLAHLLAAREDISRIMKTSSGALRDKTCCAINKVLMTGSVPDRGGRPNEIEPPMPIWEKRREGGGGSRWGKKKR